MSSRAHPLGWELRCPGSAGARRAVLLAHAWILWTPSSSRRWPVGSNRVLSLLSAVFVTTALAAQQTGTVSGTVVAAGSAAPLPGASVVIVGTARTVLTNEKGQYHLSVPAGAHTVRARLIGYDAAEQRVTVAAGQTVTSDFKLTASPLSLNEVGVDLNAIPTAAIDRIEVLRDGAAAQYGSDAIAGVINIVLKQQAEHLDLTTTAGTTAGGTSVSDIGSAHDGDQIRTEVDYGFKVGDRGFFNVAGEYLDRGATSRAAPYSGNDIFRGVTTQAGTDSALTANGLTRQ